VPIREGPLEVGQELRLGEIELRLVPSGPADAAAAAPPAASDPPCEAKAEGGTELLLPKGLAATSSAPASTASPSRPDGDGGGRKHRLLLVDDSMAFLETAGEIFNHLSGGAWEIQTACGADQALRLIKQGQLQLAVLDIHMPMLDGLQLLALLRRRHPEIKLVVLTAMATEALRAECLAAGAELFLEKPATPDGFHFVFNVMNDLLTWRHPQGFRGTLQQVGLADIIQIECLRRSSCILQIQTAAPEGEIYIESGAIVHAVAEGLSGAKALHHLLSLEDGQFHSCPYVKPSERTIQGSWEMLLMESARMRDEARGDSDSDHTTLFRKPAALPIPAGRESFAELGEAAAASAPGTSSKRFPSNGALRLAVLGEDLVMVPSCPGD
ncbi:MAG TPA: response regulator, partial [Terriglobales bacterium]|nr:response regulator [Terriglobales bacterium]